MAYILSRNAKKLLSGEDIARHEYEWQGRYVYYEPERMIDLHETARPGEATRFEAPEKLIVYRFLDRDRRFVSIYDAEQHYCLDSTYVVTAKEETKENLAYIQCLLVSHLLGFYNRLFAGVKVTQTEMERIPIHPVHFTTPADERERLTQEAIGVYGIGDNAGVIRLVQAHINSDKTDVLHDLLVHLAQRMIDINKQKQAEVKRFLGWLEKRLKILPKNDSSTGIDSLTGKAILRGYLGDYQKSEGETPWREFHYRLYQNRNRFAVSLSDVQGEIQREYETSLETLLPIKRDLARTDLLIDKIVYRLYGLTDEEIELIERPQYEQALADAKAQVVADDKIKDDEEKIEKIAEGILPAAKRFFERVEPASVEAMLDSELPNWRSLPPDAPTFLLTGDYNLHTLPEHMDFSSSVIPYTKAVETVLYERIFAPFRDGSGYADADCINEFLKDFMRGKKKLTLGNFMIILRSSRETALQTFISRIYSDAAQRVFGAKGLVATLNDEVMLDIRNKAAHDEVLSRDEAQQTRVWAMQILEQV
jgi:hypothetical protein